MGRPTTERRPASTLERFAERLRADAGATHVLLFGSHARGTAYDGSDYDIIVVSPTYEDVRPLSRGLDLWDLWYEVGGSDPIDFICLTLTEFEEAQQRPSFIAAILPEAIDLLPNTTALS